jgi:dTDP-4-dehydrorhamnose reductase
VNILLTGRDGQVGFELERALPALGEVFATARSQLDLANPDAIRRLVRDTKPGLIVNAAAYTAVDRAESEPGPAMQVNGVAPGILAEEAKRLGALLVHYSTDYVFDGTKPGPYTEDDPPNPVSAYGKTKLEGERAIAAAGGRHLILRTSWVYGPRGKNFYRTMVQKAAAGAALRVVDDQTGVPTTSEFLAQETAALLRANAAGVLNLVPGGKTTWCGFAREIFRQTGSSTPVEAIATSGFPTPARRPANSVLDNRKAAQVLGHSFPDWQALLERCIRTSADQVLR